MKIRIIGGGWYGSSLTLALSEAGHEVEMHEIGARLFNGASGANPGRLHKGFHYPRSRLTRAACLDHAEAFMARYGHLTRTIPANLYCIASEDSYLDFGTYCQVLKGEVDFVTLEKPSDLGLQNIEGAVLTGERHICVDLSREWFTAKIGHLVKLETPAGDLNDPRWDWTIDCTFCALDAEAIDRYEPCVTTLVKGPTDRAVTIMDGPFPSLYPWKEEAGLSSLTSAKLTPLSKTCRTYDEAQAMLLAVSADELVARSQAMMDQIGFYWPDAHDLFEIVDLRTAVRAMPKSGADARLVDVISVGDRALRVRAGKIDAVFRAQALIKERLGLS